MEESIRKLEAAGFERDDSCLHGPAGPSHPAKGLKFVHCTSISLIEVGIGPDSPHCNVTLYTHFEEVTKLHGLQIGWSMVAAKRYDSVDTFLTRDVGKYA